MTPEQRLLCLVFGREFAKQSGPPFAHERPKFLPRLDRFDLLSLPKLPNGHY